MIRTRFWGEAEPRQGILDPGHGLCIRRRRPVDQKHRQPKRASRTQLGHPPGPACVLGDDHGDLLAPEKRGLVGFGKWWTSDKQPVVRQAQRAVRRIHEAQEVPVRGPVGEGFDPLPSDPEKNRAWIFGKCRGCGGKVRNTRPSISGACAPRWPEKCQMPGTCRGGRTDGIGLDRRRKRMRRIHHVADPFSPEERGQTRGAAEPADPMRNGLRSDRLDPACVREYCRHPGLPERIGKPGGFARSAQNENAHV